MSETSMICNWICIFVFLTFCYGSPVPIPEYPGIYRFFNVKIGQHSRKNDTSSQPLYVNTPKKLPYHGKPDDERSPKPWTFECDMKLTPLQAFSIKSDISRRRMGIPHKKRKMVTDGRYYWPYGVVPYDSSDLDFAMSRQLLQAMAMWEERTCIKFVRLTPKLRVVYRDYVSFRQTDNGCESSIGRVGGEQTVNISDACGTGSIAHEIGHVIGFVHEQSRSDRDEHVRIIKSNILSGNEGNFEKYSNKKVTSYNLAYDIGSIMHYSDTAFSRDDSSQTIQALDPYVQSWMGQREQLSFLDVKLANEAYDCTSRCKTNFVCQNGGFNGPQCDCVCPYGMGGFTCEKVIPSTHNCGGMLRNRNGTITSPNYPQNYADDAECHWFIEAPTGTHLELYFRDFNTEKDFDVLDIRVYGPERVGQMFSGTAADGHSLMFSGNKLLLHFKSDRVTSSRGFLIEYTTVLNFDTV